MRIWKRLLGTALCLCAAVCVMSVSASAAVEHTEHPICGNIDKCTNPDHSDGNHGDAVEWIKVMQTDVTPNNGLILNDGQSYYLGEDISVKYDITINGTVNLCLNGYSITKTSASTTFSEGVITVTAGSSFTLCDCNGSGAGNGKITHTKGMTGRGVYVGSPDSSPSTTSFIMYGGTISGNRIENQDGAGVLVHSASFKMYGGTISDNRVEGNPNYGGGGVAAHTGGRFIMYGGEISRNKTDVDGGGVAVVRSSFQMSGGSIINNTATGDGGGVGLWNDSFRLSGGTIRGNSATRRGGGVYFSGYTTNSNTLTISDTVEISGNSAANGGGVYLNSAYLTVTGGNIINNNATGSGGGVYFKGDTFNVFGDVSITGNKRGATSDGSGLNGGTDNNVYLSADKTIAVAGKLTGSNQIGVTTENLPDDSNYVRIALGNKDYAKPDKFRYENADTIAVSAVVNSGTATLVACQHNWSGAWEKDTYNHWHVCSICQGKSEGSAHTYDQKKTEVSYKASDATCTSPARYYTSCVCGAKSSTETFESGGINPDKHSGALGGWQSDENNHWKEYPCCHVHMEEESHHWGAGEVTTAATCTTAGVKTFTCTVCHRTKTETLAALEHNYGEPSYVWNGTSCTAERICARDSSHKETETVTAAVTVTQHKDCVSDEVSTYKASFQNTAFAEQTKEDVVTANKLGHDFENGAWQSDGDYHWKKCSRCDVTNEENKAPHNWDTGVIKTQPTCTAPGEKTYTCVCSATRTETVSATGHNWSDAWMHDDTHHWHNCKNANCPVTENSEKSGYAEHSGGAANCTKQAVCVTCGTAYGALDPNGHDWGEWRVTKPATTSAAGEEKRVCQRNASHTETRAIPKLTPAPSGGGSSGSSSAPAITVPVSGSGDTVHVSASVSGSTAEVKEIKSAELDKIGTDSAVVIDLSGLNKGVTGVTLSTDTIDSICKTEADGVTIKLPSAELRVDRQTLAAVTEQAAGSKVRLVVEPDSTARGTMTAAQKSTLAGMKNAAALEAYFVSNGTRIHDFKGGSVELSIPYRAEGAIRAWFLKEDGTREPVSARYDKENAQLILHHFSHYVIEELDSSAAYTVCAKDDSCPLGAFGDLTAAAWYHDGVHYCLENGLMRGASGGKFLPDGSTTRAQLVTILWRLEGSPETTGAARFSDVAGGAWYTEAVRWAAGCGVVKGYDNGGFGPNDAVTREQMAAILYRYAQHKGYDVSAGEDTNILSFDDAFAVSEYAIPAMQWACGSGMVRGIAQKGGMLLAPRDTTTRAQAATLIMRFQSAFAKEH